MLIAADFVALRHCCVGDGLLAACGGSPHLGSIPSVPLCWS
jgi:hypothetical protein